MSDLDALGLSNKNYMARGTLAMEMMAVAHNLHNAKNPQLKQQFKKLFDDEVDLWSQRCVLAHEYQKPNVKIDWYAVRKTVDEIYPRVEQELAAAIAYLQSMGAS